MSHKIANHYEKVKKNHPEYLEAVEKLGLTAKNAGPIDEKNAQLIQLAASVASKSEGATHSHTKRALKALDNGFFKIRYERLTERQQEYVKAMSKAGNLPIRSSDVAERLNISVTNAAPIREEIIRKGMIYSPTRGFVDFSVPKFDDLLCRATNQFSC